MLSLDPRLKGHPDKMFGNAELKTYVFQQNPDSVTVQLVYSVRIMLNNYMHKLAIR